MAALDQVYLQLLRVLIVARYEEPEASTHMGGSDDVHSIFEQRHIGYGNVQGRLNALKECNNLEREKKICSSD